MPIINEIGKQEFGIMVQNNAGSYDSFNGTIYDAINAGYTLNIGNSKCSDGANATVNPSSVLSVNGNMVTVKSNKTIYCTLYFDKLNFMKKLYTIELIDEEENWVSIFNEYASEIESISVVDYIADSSTLNKIKTWDVSDTENGTSAGSIVAWIETNTNGNYDLLIGSKTKIYARDLTAAFESFQY